MKKVTAFFIALSLLSSTPFALAQNPDDMMIRSGGSNTPPAMPISGGCPPGADCAVRINNTGGCPPGADCAIRINHGGSGGDTNFQTINSQLSSADPNLTFSAGQNGSENIMENGVVVGTISPMMIPYIEMQGGAGGQRGPMFMITLNSSAGSDVKAAMESAFPNAKPITLPDGSIRYNVSITNNHTGGGNNSTFSGINSQLSSADPNLTFSAGQNGSENIMENGVVIGTISPMMVPYWEGMKGGPVRGPMFMITLNSSAGSDAIAAIKSAFPNAHETKLPDGSTRFIISPNAPPPPPGTGGTSFQSINSQLSSADPNLTFSAGQNGSENIMENGVVVGTISPMMIQYDRMQGGIRAGGPMFMINLNSSAGSDVIAAVKSAFPNATETTLPNGGTRFIISSTGNGSGNNNPPAGGPGFTSVFDSLSPADQSTLTSILNAAGNGNPNSTAVEQIEAWIGNNFQVTESGGAVRLNGQNNTRVVTTMTQQQFTDLLAAVGNGTTTLEQAAAELTRLSTPIMLM